MESFFLAETTKYLYLLFDPDNFLNNDGGIGTIIDTPHGECVIDTGGYIFNTEAHPIDPAALRCCYDMPYKELVSENFTPLKYLGDSVQIRLDEEEIEIDSDESSKNQNATSGNFSFAENWADAEDVQNELQKFLNELKRTTKKDKPELEIILSTNASSLAQELSKNSNGTKNTNKPTSMYENILIAEEIDDDRSSLMNDTKGINKTGRVNSESTSDDIQLESKMQRDEVISEEKIVSEFEMGSESKMFDAQRLIERVRRMYNDSNIVRNYELLSCKSQSFLQRLAVLGEILT